MRIPDQGSEYVAFVSTSLRTTAALVGWGTIGARHVENATVRGGTTRDAGASGETPTHRTRTATSPAQVGCAFEARNRAHPACHRQSLEPGSRASRSQGLSRTRGALSSPGVGRGTAKDRFSALLASASRGTPTSPLPPGVREYTEWGAIDAAGPAGTRFHDACGGCCWLSSPKGCSAGYPHSLAMKALRHPVTLETPTEDRLNRDVIVWRPTAPG